MKPVRVNVVIVGGSIAGCTAALRLSQEGISSVIIERNPVTDHYKKLCTHFIQPHALRVVQDLGIDLLLDAQGVKQTKGAFCTTAGWINPDGPYCDDQSAGYGYAVERRILDPVMRKLVCEDPNIRVISGASYKHFETQEQKGGHQYVVSFTDCHGHENQISTKLLVAADGRKSVIAKQLGNHPTETPNDRAVCLAYFEGIERPQEQRCLFYFLEKDACFLYPLTGDRTLLSVCIEKERAAKWRNGDTAQAMMDYFKELPDVPSFDRAKCVSPVYGYKDYPNLMREPLKDGVPFIGDAAQSLDAMAGVGIGFALVGADLLVTCAAPALRNGSDMAAALDRYATSFHETFDGHVQGILADARIAKNPSSVQKFYRSVIESETLQRQYVAMTGRLISPTEFQKSYLAHLVASSKKQKATDAVSLVS